MALVDDVQMYLEAADIIGGSSGFASIRRRMTDDVDDNAVVITEDGGPAPELTATEGIGDTALATPGVQVRVRSAAWDGDTAMLKAREILGALHSIGGVIGEHRYLGIRAMTPEPIFIGYDDRGRPEATISFRATALVADLYPPSSSP